MKTPKKILTAVMLSILAGASNTQAGWTLGGGLVVRSGYDYGPTAMREGSKEKMWWTAQGTPINGNPLSTDLIYYQETDLSIPAVTVSPTLVFGPRTSGFDSVYVADPAVVKGQFYNPQNGNTYLYAMYYTATDDSSNNGCDNRIGVAFSNDGRAWVRYTTARIYPFDYPTTTYGCGQPSVFNGNGVATLVLFHHDSTTHSTFGAGTHLWSRRTSDGITFSDVTKVVLTGTGTSASANCDFAYYNTANPKKITGAIELPGRAGDRETYRICLAEISSSDLLSGIGTWTVRGTISTTLTGNYLNHSPGILRDVFGNDSFTEPTVQVDYTRGDNTTSTWDITHANHTP